MANHEILEPRHFVYGADARVCADKFSFASFAAGVYGLRVPKKTEFHLTHGDCVAGMAQMPAESIDVVVTSPPYNLGIAYKHYDDSKSRAEYLQWSREWAAQVHRLLKADGSFFLNVGAAPSNPMLPYEILVELKDLFVLQNTFHWIKAVTIETRAGESISAGHFKPINSPRYVNDCHEFVFHLTKTGKTKIDRLSVGVPYADKSNIKRWSHTGGRDKRCRGNNWFIPYETIKSRDKQRPHPATFPVELVSKCIRLHSYNKNIAMLDPFLGIGSAALAAKACGVERFYGFEVDDFYLREAKLRLSESTDLVLRSA